MNDGWPTWWRRSTPAASRLGFRNADELAAVAKAEVTAAEHLLLALPDEQPIPGEDNPCWYYKNSNGRPCGPNDGRACKICGG
ncbi:MAG: hypothetical protein GXY83_39520 [Rhodopirellula sp.]|nr:hypothetical protein [Rhodopirellula sp.]